mgnify:CR=1 FL=1
MAADLAKVVQKRGAQVVLLDEDAGLVPGAKVVTTAQLGSSIDVLVVLGGDGTFLRASSLVSDHGVPVLGINLGTLGFMTHYVLGEATTALESVCEDRMPIDERMRLRVGVWVKGQEVEVRNALNEAVISQRGIARLLDLTAELDGNAVTTYKADGLILSTPTGSTAYNLAAGGPILTPNLEAMVLTPICPHTFTNRPVVMRADARIVLTNDSKGPVMLTLDGQWTRELGPGESIQARKADKPLRTFRADNTFFAILRQKLSWGERNS